MNYQYLDSPVGRLRLVSDGHHLTAIEWENRQGADPAGEERTDPALKACAQQLGEYFAGKRRHFDLPLLPAGTPFQQQVWAALAAIPYGALRSYRDVARTLDRPKAVRAVGAANGRNPLPIVVPCHRVIGSDGSLTGFAGGLAAKQVLLRLEGAIE
ncbi:methylated-DNA--[protein]-cysteine S-methyltransferase [Seongchinamella unica]|uniref:Methylated-DNA--protein-cysteine methyltransferase n=1 Tax=Seongchinamella unica TaxID=2547392 RepID=A0A4R5LQ94_9GAMM|nr:methylated-DNA--[protein]-cysteine S-methyltransferase [Seongchinamella unica]TDG12744.1 methylated-DNA--[protein]-cysteine S-methyltransferase [Seongchinamella unica]